ncbi:hypothetical protein DER44DRAFT_707834 [Fusarium oxysporum]|nr:hypothetical protein DER44DRAFT_707834 [Fusarium oxysporum]
MDISRYAADPKSYDKLSEFQVDSFFTNASVTKVECDEFAAQLLDGPVSATPIQGGNSYTVESEHMSKVVQFRSSQLDMKKLEIAQNVYLKFVPQGKYHNTLGTFHVYIWDRIPAPAFCRVRRKMFASDMIENHGLGQTVQDFARFFALAWLNESQSPEPLPIGLQESYCADLDKLSLTLPESLHSTIDRVRKDLHLLFRPEYPTVVQHGDILENNIHVDEATGHITGIVDWHDAFIAPFGLSLGGVEILFGLQSNKNWHFHPSHVKLRQQFWERFNTEVSNVSESDKQAMEVARLMGLFKMFGFEPNGAVYLERLVSYKID